MNKALTFLSNLGKMVLTGLNLIPAVTKVVESSAGQAVPVLDKLSQISTLVQQGEVILSDIAGPQRAQKIAPLVAQVIMSSELVAGRKIDPTKQAAFLAACTALGGDVADVLNCLEPDSTTVATQNATATAPPTGVVVPVIPLAAVPAPTATAPTAPASAPAAAPAAPALSPTFQSVAAVIPDTPGVAAAIAAGMEALPED